MSGTKQCNKLISPVRCLEGDEELEGAERDPRGDLADRGVCVGSVFFPHRNGEESGSKCRKALVRSTP